MSATIMDRLIGDDGVIAQSASDAEREVIIEMNDDLAKEFDLMLRYVPADLWYS